MCPKKFYVYILIDPRSNLPFYIGKGFRYRVNMHLKLYKSDTTNKLKINKIKKLIKLNTLPIIQIYKDGLEEQEALDIETKLIKKYGRLCDNSGILTNFIVSDKLMSGKNNPNFGNKWTNKQKENLRNKKLGKKGHKHTEEYKKYISSIQPKHSFYSIDSITYEVKKWESVFQFRDFLGIDSRAGIYQSLKLYSCKIKNFYLRNLDYDNIEYLKIKDINLFKVECDKHKNFYRKTVQKDLNGNIIKIWNSRTEIVKQFNMKFSTFSQAIKNKKMYKGFIWE